MDLRWPESGLLPAIAQSQEGEVLMLAWMSLESWAETLRTGQVTYWSRSRQAFWRKGATSGHTQRLIEARIDCDQDAILMIVEQVGPACHTGRRSCFSWAPDGTVLAEPMSEADQAADV